MGDSSKRPTLEVVAHVIITPDDDAIEDHGDIYLDHQMLGLMGKYGKVDVKHLEVIEHT